MTTAELILEVKQDHCPKCGHGSAGMYWDQEIEELACRLCGWRSGSRPAVLGVCPTILGERRHQGQASLAGTQ